MGKIDKWMLLLFGLVGGWLIATFPGWVEAWEKEYWWEIATAFGTVGATAAAVIVPLYQNWDRRREQRRGQLRVEWALAEEVYRISCRLSKIGKSLQASAKGPSVSEIDHMQTQLSSAKMAVTDRVGNLLIEDLLFQIIPILDEAKRRDAGVSSLSANAAALGKSPVLDEATLLSIDSLSTLREQSFLWLDRVISQLNVEGIIASSTFKASGKSTVRFLSGD